MQPSISAKRAAMLPHIRTRATPNKISYLSVPGERSLLGLTIGQLLENTATRFPDHDGLIVAAHAETDTGVSVRHSFRDLHIEITNLAAGLLTLGLERGARVGIWGPNSHLYYVTQLAIWKAGLVCVNINSAFQTRELEFCLKNVGVEALVIAEPFKSQNYYQMLCSVVAKGVTTLKAVLTMESKPRPGTLTVLDIMDRGDKSPTARARLAESEAKTQFDDVANIQFTSGTTSGVPKGAMLTHHNIVNNSFLYGKRAGFNEHDRIALTVPLFHSFGCVTGTVLGLHFGTALVMTGKAFEAGRAVQILAKEKCTVVYGTPTMHIAMLNAIARTNRPLDLSNLRIACTGAAPCPEELVKEMKAVYTVTEVGVSYGMTETGPIVFQSLPKDNDSTRAGTVGYPGEHTEVKIVDPATGEVVPCGSVGELCVRGYLTTSGYWNDPDKTNELLDSAKWVHTGDLFLMHESGHGSIVGRLKDVIIRGGENIYPKEIEDFLYSHPAVCEVAVFGVPDAVYGEQVAAWLVLHPGQTLNEEELRTYCCGKVAHYKVPRFIQFVDEFPKTASGKIQKFRMREEFLKERERQQEQRTGKPQG